MRMTAATAVSAAAAAGSVNDDGDDHQTDPPCDSDPGSDEEKSNVSQ